MNKHVVFTGGGTGGHVYPALAILEILRDEGYKVTWIGSKKGIEYSIIKKQNIDFYSIPSGKLRRYFSILNFIDLFKITAGFLKSFILLIKLKPDLIFSKGGYVTVPPIVISKILGIKSITHESDFDPGLATRINSKFVDKIFVPYNETIKYFPASLHNKITVTGNPVRQSFFNRETESTLKLLFPHEKPLIIVIGGSLGAKDINDAFISDKEELTKHFNIYHQMGTSNYQEINEESYITVPYIESTDKVLKEADLVVSRSGAGLIWEYITLGLPMVLIPLVAGSRGDQVKNAEYFQKKGAAVIIKNSSLKNSTVTKELLDIFDNGSIDILRENSKKLGSRNSTKEIVKIIKETV